MATRSRSSGDAKAKGWMTTDPDPDAPDATDDPAEERRPGGGRDVGEYEDDAVEEAAGDDPALAELALPLVPFRSSSFSSLSPSSCRP